MKHVNWQAYADGSLSAEDRSFADQLLASDPSAVEERNGFLAFFEETRKRGLEEPVPRKDLDRMLRDVVKAERPKPVFSWARVSIPATALILIAVGILWWKHDPMEFAVTPIAAVLESTEMPEAEAWLERNTGYDVPKLDLPREATLVMARYGERKDWACIDFMHDGQLYLLYMKRDGSSLGRSPTRIFDGQGFFEGQGVGWKTAGLSYYLKGGTPQGRWSFATHLAPQTQAANRT
jgi:hypothetical protein